MGASNIAAAYLVAARYCEDFVPEDDVLLRARERAAVLAAPAVSPGTGAVLSVIAASLQARSVVEIGTGTGVGSLWLLRGMPDDGVLTTLDADPERQRAAKTAFAEGDIRSHRTRVISRRAADVLPRLADGGYDMVVLSADHQVDVSIIDIALRLLRPGGVLAIDGALLGGDVADPTRRDPETVLMRTIAKSLRDDERTVVAMVPGGDGLLLAVRR